jgi:hypothetical protein
MGSSDIFLNHKNGLAMFIGPVKVDSLRIITIVDMYRDRYYPYFKTAEDARILADALKIPVHHTHDFASSCPLTKPALCSTCGVFSSKLISHNSYRVCPSCYEIEIENSYDALACPTC